MQANTQDLFPASLLCYVRDGVVYTSSVHVAEFSKKRHKDVLKAIENKLKVLPEGFRGRNFAPTIRPVPGPKGAVRQEKMVEMTEEGFALTMMGFTGKEAVQWQVDFIEAFMAQRAQLHAQRDRYVGALRVIRPALIPTVQDAQAGLPRLHTADLLDKSVGAITYHRRVARRLGLLGESA